MWDTRFAQQDYVYGIKPNDFLVSYASKLPSGPVLSIGEGEGRNATFLATRGYEVTAVDGSSVGLQKAKKLAADHGAKIETIHSDLAEFRFGKEKWASIISIFCHLPKPLRKKVLQGAVEGLMEGGVILLEAYTPRQLSYGTGGPKTEDNLVDPEDLRIELEGLELEYFRAFDREIHEGILHNGMSAVVQVFARKKSH
jgi:SAM-dependent methyltransferase